MNFKMTSAIVSSLKFNMYELEFVINFSAI